ncbi:MAG: sodium:calcium antiporter [Acidobacteria bacterium]|nr:MAG: sodium:calcium antiporter [Acidobacteriota bacterium]REJ99003.1 MAG: sodium:calcium antiporter [Acidobacteriota bacterium]REK16277.1 MAG: sodium:calcium antiporter [Acidobacteriota bacterium]REK43958.1 MAG: sodium:calcium antiporter [Acidobacteriota bacterium]
MLFPILLLIAGFVILTLGAEGLVRSGSSIALRLGITPFVVGLTFVALGTSSPELVVSVQAAFAGSSALAIGNIVGSNISNTALILGVAALIYPLKAKTVVIRREMPVMVAITGVFWLMILDGSLDRLDGLLLVLSAVAYTLFIYFSAKRGKVKGLKSQFSEGLEGPGRNVGFDALMLVGGVGFLVLGANLLVNGAVQIAKFFEIPEVVIGLTLVAVGTSLPELATSAVAAFRNKADMALGNAIGSNISNIAFVLGVTALVNPIEVGDIRTVDLAVMLGTAVFLWALLGIRFVLDRLEAFILLVVYALYIYTLFP